MPSKLYAALLFLALGVIKLPVEEYVAARERAAHLVEKPLGLDMREQLGQKAFAASLGGLRSLVASITYLQAYVAFENVEWGKLDSLMMLTTRLQPREETYWADAAWHMAYNASSYYLNDQSQREAMRKKLYRDYSLRGEAILKEGLVYIPQSHLLYSRLGELYRDRLAEPRKAAEALLAAYERGAKDFYERMAAYEMVKLNDRPSWERALKILMKHYNSGKPTASMLRDIPVLEERLGIPIENRIKPEQQLPPNLRSLIKVPGPAK
jgi:hypothetical protein